MSACSVLLAFVLILGSAFFGGLLAKKVKQPVILGYLLAGVVVSGVLSKLGLKSETLGLLPEVGIALLLFTLGLEFSLKRLEKLKGRIFSGALIQIVLTILLGALSLVAFFFFKPGGAIVIAAALSLSSTAVVVKVLTEKNMLESLSGEIMVGWLLVQDLAVLPLLCLMPVFFGKEAILEKVIFSLQAGAVLGGTFFLARILVPKLTDFVIKQKSRELLIIFVLALVFLMALLTSSLGFSLALGAFLAGLILSQTEARFAVFSEIRPLRDVFLAVFFVSLGLSIETNFLFANFGRIFSIALLFSFLKILVVAFLLLFFGYHVQTMFTVSFGLAQVGEFAFVLAAFAAGRGFISRGDYQLIIPVTLLTMVATPWFFSLSESFYRKMSRCLTRLPNFLRSFFVKADYPFSLEELPCTDHVVILGYGRVGHWVGQILKKTRVPFLVVEYDPNIVRRLKLSGEKVIFGDPADINILDFAQVDKAKLVVVALPDPLTQKMVITNCRSLNPKVKIICRSHVDEDGIELHKMGVESVIQPEFEAALSISHRTLQAFDFNHKEVVEKIKQARKEHEG